MTPELKDKLESLLTEAAKVCKTPVQYNQFLNKVQDRLYDEKTTTALSALDISKEHNDIINYGCRFSQSGALHRPGGTVQVNGHQLPDPVGQNPEV